MDTPGAGRGTFENLLYDLLSASPSPLLVGRDEDAAELVFPAGNRALLLRWNPDEAALGARMKLAMKAGLGELVLVGGPVEAKQLLKKATPFYLPVACIGYHLPESGPLWQSKSPMVKSPLEKALKRGVQGASDEAAWGRLIAEQSARQAEAQAESGAFQETLASGKPLATYGLVAVIAAVFVLELVLGGSDSGPVLVKMGALVPSRVAREPWRLLSYSFLHAGFMHVLLNSYVLLVLGDLLERVLGSFRFLVVYSLAVLGSGFAVILFSDASLTVGASGGVWGLLAAHSILSYFPRGLLPKAVLPAMQKAAMTNLVLNVLNSFRPQVSMSGHFGGGMVGAALLALPLLTSGLPRLGEPAPEGGRGKATEPLWLKAAAGLGAAALLLSLALALRAGASAGLFAGDRLDRVALAQVGLSVEMPAALALQPPTEVKSEGAHVVRFTFGVPAEDTSIYELEVRRFDQKLPGDSLDRELDQLAEALAKGVESFNLRGKPVRKPLGGRAGLVVVMDGSTRPITYERAFALDEGELINVDAVYPRDQAGAAGSAERALLSLQPVK